MESLGSIDKNCPHTLIELAVKPGPDIAIDLCATTAGRRAIAGFLLQILRSIKLGLDMSLSIAPLDDGGQMRLHLEPVEGSDVQVVGGARDIVEQIKMRKGARQWSTHEVAKKVLPDLLRAVRPGREQRLRFTTNNPAGLAPLQAYLASRAAPRQRLRWGKSSLTRGAFEQRLAAAAGLPAVTPELRALLDNLEIEIIDVAATEREIEAALRPLLKPPEDPSDKRFQLTGQLMTLATGGATLTPQDLLRLIHPDAHRLLAHIQSLPALLARHAEEDAQLIGYRPAAQARLSLPELATRFAVLSGESGQGKTWTLAQFAFGQIGRGDLGVVMRSPSSIEEVVARVNERIWHPAHPAPAPLSVIAKQIGDAFCSADGIWLTIYIDDVQDRRLAERLAREKWDQLGIRTVLSCQPRITCAIQAVRHDAEVVRIGDFRGGDLLRYLTHYGRQDALPQMPDDVFELLLKPVHASIFVQLPGSQAWSSVSEYALFSAYWRYASLTARDQPDHPGDSWALKMLARALAKGDGHYPWRIADLRLAGLDDEAMLRLEAVGLLRRPTPDRVVFAADRMLNWAVAEALVDTIEDEGLSARDADALLSKIEDLETRAKEPIGARLGYVYFDAVWLLARRCSPEFIAELIRQHVTRLPQEHRMEEHWRSGFGSIGGPIVPALEILARQSFDEDSEWDIPRTLPHALAAVAAAEPEPVLALIARQVASASAADIDLGLRTARLVPAAAALDAIFAEHLARSRAFAAAGEFDDDDRPARNRWSNALSRQELSSDALRRAVAADPAWLDAKLAAETDGAALDQLLWILRDEDVVESEVASRIWSRHRDRIVGAVPMPSNALVEVIGHFRETSLAGILDTIDPADEARLDRVLASRARVEPQVALRQIAEGSDAYPWRASSWWFDDLFAADAAGLSKAIRERASRSDDPLTELILFYTSRPEAMDERTLEHVLDLFAARLEALNAANDDPEERGGRLGHPLRFLPKLSEPWQFEALRRRAGQSLETELAGFAARRRGRTSLNRDTSGNECELILAMIGGAGYDRLVVAELERPDLFGRQDGYISAHWSEAGAVRTALAATPAEETDASFGRVIRMEALGIHRLDAELEAMLRAGAPVYVNAAAMRSAQGRDAEPLRTRIAELLAAGDPASLDMAAALSGFLGSPNEARRLVALFTDPATPIAVCRRLTGTFRALSFYTPELLPRARTLLEGRIDDEAQFVATYLAELGDEEARRAVIAWVGAQDIGSQSTSRRSYIEPLLEHADGKAAVLAFLRRSRANGHLIVDGRYLVLLAEDGDEWAQGELARATYRFSGFERGNAFTAIKILARTEPDEAYFAARRLFGRHGLVMGADLMLLIDRERAGAELMALCETVKPSLRLDLLRRLRVRLGGTAMADLIAPVARAEGARRRAAAAHMSAVLPPHIGAPWLGDLAKDGSPAVRTAARRALRARGREAAAMAHVALIPGSPKPLQWARLAKVIELVDPYFLWSATDAASLGALLGTLPHEFIVDARKRREQGLKKREDAAKKADRNT